MKIQTIPDLPYVTRNGRRLRLNLHRPAQSTGPLPVVLWVPGGGWFSSDRNEFAGFYLVEQGFAVASIDYRVSPQDIAPANIHDCQAAVRWLRRHAATYGLDPDRIGVWGSSAGGHLAALLGLSNGRAALAEAGADAAVSSSVRAVCDFCGPSDLTGIAQPPIRKVFHRLYGVTAQYLGGPVGRRRKLARLVSPLQYVSPSCPPILIAHGDQDPTVPVEESIILHNALRQAGADSTLCVLKGQGHGWDPGLTAKRVVAFFKRTLKPAAIALVLLAMAGSVASAIELQWVGTVGNSGAIHMAVGRRGGGVVVDAQGRIFTGGGDRVLVLDDAGRVLWEVKLPRPDWVVGGPTFAVYGKDLYFLAGAPVPWEKRYYHAAWTMLEPNLCRVEMAPDAQAELVVPAEQFKDYKMMDIAVMADPRSVYVGYTTSWEASGGYSIFEATAEGKLQRLFTVPVMNGRASVDEDGHFYLGGNKQVQKVDRRGQPVPGFTAAPYPDLVALGMNFAGAVMLTRDAIWEMGGHGWVARYTREFKPNPGMVAQHQHALGMVAQVADGPAGTYYLKSPDALYQARIAEDRLTLLRRFGSLPEVLGLGLTANGYVCAGYGDVLLWFDFDNPDPTAVPVRSQYYGPIAQGFPDGDGWVSLSNSGWPTDYQPPPRAIRLVRYAPEPYAFLNNTFTGVGNGGEFAGRLTTVACAGEFYFGIDQSSQCLVRSTAKEPCQFVAVDGGKQPLSSICAIGPKLLLAGSRGIVQSFAVAADGSITPLWQLSGFGNEVHLATSGNGLLIADTERHRVMFYSFGATLQVPPTFACQYGMTDQAGDSRARLKLPTLVALSGGRAALYDSGNQRVVKLRIR